MRTNTEKRLCSYCGKEYIRTGERRHSKYCSNKCSDTSKREGTKKRLLGVSYEKRYGDKAEQVKANLWRNRPRHEFNIPYVGGDGRNWIKTRKGRVRYAVYLAKKFIVKRDLYAYECVHHKDGDPANDNVENLMVVTRVEHNHIHKPQNHRR